MTECVCVCSDLSEPVCAVGQGISALCCAIEGHKWIFNGYSLTGVSVRIQQMSHQMDIMNISVIIHVAFLS